MWHLFLSFGFFPWSDLFKVTVANFRRWTYAGCFLGVSNKSYSIYVGSAGFLHARFDGQLFLPSSFWVFWRPLGKPESGKGESFWGDRELEAAEHRKWPKSDGGWGRLPSLPVRTATWKEAAEGRRRWEATSSPSQKCFVFKRPRLGTALDSRERSQSWKRLCGAAIAAFQWARSAEELVCLPWLSACVFTIPPFSVSVILMKTKGREPNFYNVTVFRATTTKAVVLPCT